MKPSRFELSKWYMDCVSPAGDAVLAYCADLRWHRVNIAYRSALEMRAGAPAVVSSSLEPDEPPVVDASRICWRSAALGIRAHWTETRPAPKRDALALRLYDSPEGSIDWACLSPAAEVRVETRHGTYAGYGYVEHVRMTIAPWRLPISSLRWGRIATRDDAIVWIQWRGGFETTIVHANGDRLAASQLDDARVALADETTIQLDRRQVLRSGALRSTVLPSIPVLRDLAPFRLLTMRERKWLSRAVITGPRRVPTETWAIHELVTFPKRAHGS